MLDSDIDKPSYELGVIAAFAEVVALGLKDLGLSSPLEPEVYEEIRERADEIIQHSGIKWYPEKDFLVTDLFAEEMTWNKYVMFLYKDDAALEAYLDLKRRKKQLVDADAYEGEARTELAYSFGELLDYSEDTIKRMLSR
jgi:hypothetical protein